MNGNGDRNASLKPGISMREIGRQLGVSAVTVSKALGGKPGVSDSVREYGGTESAGARLSVRAQFS